MAIQTINPTTNQVVQSFEEMTEPAIDAAVAQAATAFEAWKTTTYPHRAKLLRRVAAQLRAQKPALARLVTLEMGKLLAQAEGEIELSANIVDYYAEHGAAFLADQPLHPDHGTALVRHSPVGVLLGVEPWNFPFYQVARFAAPNLMIGNAVLVKHASSVPQCGIAIERLLREAGAPAGLYTNLLISGRRADALVTDLRIKGVSLTGSEAAGASVAAAAGQSLKKSVLELGGSDAFIVLEDADIDRTVDWAVVGRINNNGECCVAAKRLIAVEAVADEFLRKFTAKMAALRVGDPLDPAAELGPLSSEAAAAGLVEQVQRAVHNGATVVLGGQRVARPGAFMAPTILTDLTPANPVFCEELFGPVAAFFRVPDEAAAIALANDSPFGLGGSVFTRDVARGQRVADQLDTGMVFVNHPTWTQADLPFGGTKRSGYGRELAGLGIEEFVNKKLIRVSALIDPF
ncbi:NAD-dependent succinate-semialdehyde dehydrogenase [Hymenobacter psoromatis]|uniref:NAD-dependent succinate-semialdehyde dehydrogenase n=1 Tax=Hymenobacter psoromatis TaxID=1484116 RepID=UPI001CC0863D|nr:NAD-dependent succinate-semialdehyde dehydrogenase [Hymenobacter psoromatis]